MDPPSLRNRVKCGVLGGGLGGEQFFGLRYAYITNLSSLGSLEPFEKFLVVGGWWWVVVVLNPSLVFSLGPS